MPMPTANLSPWYHCNAYSADTACEHCLGVIRHESWCISCNEEVAYAYEVVMDAGKLSLGDQLILHALGVVWSSKMCKRDCQTLATAG